MVRTALHSALQLQQVVKKVPGDQLAAKLLSALTQSGSQEASPS
jgi:hypothetical protein